MNSYVIHVGGTGWKVSAGSAAVAINKGVKAQARWLRDKRKRGLSIENELRRGLMVSVKYVGPGAWPVEEVD